MKQLELAGWLAIVSKSVVFFLVVFLVSATLLGVWWYRDELFESVGTFQEFAVQNILVIISVILAIIPILIALIGIAYRRHRRLTGYYEVRWKKSSLLKPREVLGFRAEQKYGFDEYYYWREEDETIRKKIDAGKSVLVIGEPLTGKSRSIHQALIALKETCNVIIPKLVEINPNDFRIPFCWPNGRKRILLLDDLNKFVEKKNFTHLLKEFLKKNIIIVASCRSGPELDIVNKRIETMLSVFGDPVEITEISTKQGEKIAKKSGRKLPSRFDHKVGSIFLPLHAMKKRFANCSKEGKTALRAINRLYSVGIYREREFFSLEKIKLVCKRLEEMELSAYEWSHVLNELQKKGFIEIVDEEIWAEEVYLEFIVQDDFSLPDNFDDMIDIFCEDPQALSGIGEKAIVEAFIDVYRERGYATVYMKAGIKALRKALKFYSLKHTPNEYANTLWNLGATYVFIASAENKSENCRRAIEAFKQALRVYTYERFPVEYAHINRNIGHVLEKIAELEDAAENCRSAIEAFKQALRVYTFDDFPLDFALTMQHLGFAYETLGKVENTSENHRNAIETYNEALRVYTKEGFPEEHRSLEDSIRRLRGFTTRQHNPRDF